MSETEPRTVDQALERFELVGGTPGSESDGTACAMSLLSWVDGSVWSDHPECAYPRLADVVIAANDAAATTVEQRVELVRAGVTGVLDTWWLPGVVVAWAIAEGIKAGDDPVARALATMAAVGRWKTSEVKPRPVLRGADLRGAVLSRAVLSGADLSDADLSRADLSRAVLRGAVLSGAVLRGADLRGAVLRGADLRGAVLSGADLSRADLSDADLSRAVLRGAVLRGAVLRGGAGLSGAGLSGARGNKWTMLPDGWQVTGAGAIERVAS